MLRLRVDKHKCTSCRFCESACAFTHSGSSPQKSQRIRPAVPSQIAFSGQASTQRRQPGGQAAVSRCTTPLRGSRHSAPVGHTSSGGHSEHWWQTWIA